MQNSKRYSFIFICCIIFTLSCSKSFLTEPPRTTTIEDLINNPQDGAQRLIGSIYSKLYDWNVHTFSWIGISSITSDDADKEVIPEIQVQIRQTGCMDF
jgi:hypothetical protein